MTRRRRVRVASSSAALLAALVLCYVVLDSGPGSMVWLIGGDTATRWVPLAGTGLSWLPGQQKLTWVPAAAQQAAGSIAPAAATSTPHATSAPTTRASVSPAPPVATQPAGAPPGTTAPTSAPVATPSPTPTAAPTPTPTQAPTPTPSATPTPPTVLLADNFEQDPVGPAVPGWVRTPAGAWSVVQDGSHVLNGTGAGWITAASGQPAWSNYTVGASVKAGAGDAAYVMARSADGINGYGCGLDHGGLVYLGRRSGGLWTPLATAPYASGGAAYYSVTFKVQGSTLTCKVVEPGTGRSATVTASGTDYPSGEVGAAALNQGRFDNFIVTAG